MTTYLSNRDGNGKTSEEGHYKFPVNTWSGTVLTSTDLLVTQQSPTALGVKIAPGVFKILDTSGNYSFTGWNSADINLSVSTADPANPRISAIVLYVDKGAATSPSPPNNPGIVKVMSVNGTPAAVPAAPNGATIQAAVGASNPYIVLANATVAAAGTTILNAAISDQRVLIAVGNDLVSTGSIRNSAVTSAKIATNGVATANITDLNVTTAKLANNAVTAAKIETQQAWQTASLQNSWVNHTPGTYPIASYYKDSLGTVSLQGLVKNGTIGATIFTLPAGYRPLGQLHIAIASNGAFANIAITPAGAVQIQNGSNGWVSLDAVNFRAEQ